MQLNIPGVKYFEKGVVVKYSDYCFANGSCADIWRAKLGDNTVAVKVWRGVPYTEELKRTFHQLLSKELGIWEKLKHPSIVAFFGLVEGYGHLPGLVLPFYGNGTAIEHLRRFEETPVLPLVKDVASALSYMQSFDPPFSHGELKASNILIDDNGKALLCDFGLGSINGIMNFTSANVCGTCRWTAPEIMTPPEDVPFVPATPASDVYSFAMTMIELYTRKQPFSHIRNDAAVIFEAVEGRRPRRPLPHVAPQLTDDIWKIMEHCWTHEAKDRPSADVVFHWLETLEELELHFPALPSLPEDVAGLPKTNL